MTQKTLSETSNTQGTRPPKWPIIHIGGSRKKAKAHKQIQECIITEDDVDLVIERVQDHITKAFEEDENQRWKIRNELVDTKKVLEHIQAMQMQERGIEPIPRETK